MPDNDFDKMFEEASAADGKDKKAQTTPVTDVKEVDVEGKDVDTKTKDVEATPKAKEGDDTDDVKLEQQYRTLQGMFEAQEREKSALAAKAKELEDKIIALDLTLKGTPKPEVEPEDADLEEYLKDYSYISANEAKLRKKELKTLKDEIIEEISKLTEVPFKTVERMMEDNINEKADIHTALIVEAHNDYGKEYGEKEITEWIDSLKSPSIRKAYKLIAAEGDSSEVIDLISKYKEAKGIVTDEPEVGDDANDEAKKEKQKEKKLDSLEVVQGKKSPVVGDPKKRAETYEDAFKEAAAG